MNASRCSSPRHAGGDTRWGAPAEPVISTLLKGLRPRGTENPKEPQVVAVSDLNSPRFCEEQSFPKTLAVMTFHAVIRTTRAGPPPRPARGLQSQKFYSPPPNDLAGSGYRGPGYA